ncbi:MAG TPA: penicillin acylase family protein, partial [Wenzhouxiangella sp.]|nr:penicillin acylase family protein [Wenzhouxiangella sp.]
MKKSLLLIIGVLLAASLQAQSISAPELSAPVNVYIDDAGIPTIVGETESDVNFVRGFLHARDRLFHMDYLRRVSSGTLAELLGPAALASDVELRTLGLRRGALATWQQLDADEKNWVKAYADGVNAYIASDEELPPEYGALELTRVERWSPVDSLIIGKLLAFQLSFDSGAVDRTMRLGAYQAVGEAAGFDGASLYFEDLVRAAPMDDRVTIPGFLEAIGVSAVVPDLAGAMQDAAAAPSSPVSNRWNNLPWVDDSVMHSLSQYMERVQQVPLLQNTMGRAENRAGSNWWLVSGDHTDSGYPFMANDPHLGLTMPALMINENIVIRDENRAVSGITPPGVPLTLLGCNLNICWGLTNHEIDVTDYFMEETLTNAYGLPTHTVHEDGAEPLLYAFQSYFVNNVGDGVPDSVEPASVGYDAGGITFLVPRRNNGPV